MGTLAPNREPVPDLRSLARETYFQALIEHHPVALVLLNVAHQIVLCNAAFEYLFGYEERELLGSSLNALIAPDHLQREATDITHRTHHGQVVCTTTVRRRRDGSLVDVDIHSRPIHIEGVFWGEYVLYQNITDRVREERARKDTEQRLQAVVDNMPAIVFMKDRDGRYMLLNPLWEETHGIPRSVALGKTDRDLFPAQMADALSANDLRVLASGKPCDFEEVGSSGRRTVLSTKFPLRDGRGNVYAVAGVSTDVTERREVEKNLQRLALAVEHTAETVLISDDQGVIQYVNPAFERTTGYTRQEVIGQTPRVLKSGRHDRAFYRQLWQTITRGETWNGRLQNRKKDGTIYVADVTISPVLDATGKIANFVSVETDVTDRIALEARSQQRQKLESIGQLAAGVAHEINSPTQYVTDNTVFLRRAFGPLVESLGAYEEFVKGVTTGGVNAERAKQLQRALKKTNMDFLLKEVPRALDQSLEGLDRVSTIVGAMKEFAHPARTEKQPVDLRQAIEATATVARHEWKYVAEMVTEFDPDLPAVLCLRDEFNQAMLNFIVNAAHAISDATAGGSSGKGTIKITVRRRGEWVEIRVSDTGPGIPGEVLPRIFDPFFTTKEIGRGTGQGLAIARSVIVDGHGGYIDVESSVGKGTVVIITLPIRDAAVGARQETA